MTKKILLLFDTKDLMDLLDIDREWANEILKNAYEHSSEPLDPMESCLIQRVLAEEVVFSKDCFN